MSRKYFSLRTVGLLSIAATIGFLSTGSQVSAASNYNLISNAVYLNKNSMSRAQIQSFLESKGSKLATYKDQGPNETKKELASYLIWHAAQIWSINPQVILATLQKEQSLITNPNPSSIALRSAMGYDCPDSSACNSLYYGFANQVNMATYQFRYNYEALKGNSSFVDIDGDVHGVGQYACNGPTHFYNNALRPGNTVTFKRNTAFSSTKDKTVKIANEATASLLCYTPHVGPYSETGYSGSDNFVYWFKQWFGSTHYTTKGAIGAKYKSLGGASSFLGEPQSNEIKLSSGKVYQKFENGEIYWSHKTGAWPVHGAIKSKYLSLGADKSPLGLPTSEEIAISGGTYQLFEYGRVYWSGATGARVVRGAVHTRYLALNANGGFLGTPTSDEISISGGVYQQFQNGRIYWSGKTGAHSVSEAIFSYYKDQPNNSTVIGYPLGEPSTLGGVTYQQFQKRDIYADEDGVRTTLGAVRARHLNRGGANGALGIPTSNEILISGGVYQQFQNGRIYWSGKTGAWDVSQAIETYFASKGYANGYLGYPISSVSQTNEILSQQFQKGSIYHHTTENNTYDTHGAIGSKYASIGRHSSFLGVPLSNEVPVSGGVYQPFERGRIYWSGSTGARILNGAIQSRYLTLNANTSYLGYPTSDEIRVKGGVYQQFQGGRIYWSGSTGAWGVHGAVQSRYLSLGAERSKLGYPTSEEIPMSGGVYQQFKNGTIYWKAGKTSVSYK